MASRVEIENYIITNPGKSMGLYAKHFQMQESALKLIVSKFEHNVQEKVRVFNTKAGTPKSDKTVIDYNKIIYIKLSYLLEITNEPELLQEEANFLQDKQRSFMWFENSKEYSVENK